MVRVLFRMDHECLLPSVCFTEIRPKWRLFNVWADLWQSLLLQIIGPHLINISFFGIHYWVLSSQFILSRILLKWSQGHVKIQASKSCDWWVYLWWLVLTSAWLRSTFSCSFGSSVQTCIDLLHHFTSLTSNVLTQLVHWLAVAFVFIWHRWSAVSSLMLWGILGPAAWTHVCLLCAAALLAVCSSPPLPLPLPFT